MVNELLEGIHLVTSMEAISLGAKAGIHPLIVYDIISNAAGNSWYIVMLADYPFSVSCCLFMLQCQNELIKSIFKSS